MRNLRIIAAVFVACTCLAMNSWAAETWLVDRNNSGQPYRWSNGMITWFAEDGSFATLSNQELVGLVQQAFGVWKKAGLSLPGSVVPVPTTAVQSKLGGLIKEVTRPNKPIEAHLHDSVQKHIYDKFRTIIIFDSFGEFNNNPAVAAETYLLSDDSNLRILAGVTVINGKSDTITSAKNLHDVNDEHRLKLLATIIHELGHLYNLDHSVLNDDVLNKFQSAPESVPTMYPDIGTVAQTTLHKDDVIAISNLYPRTELTSKFCEIAGQVIGSDGLGLQGVHIVARSMHADDELTDAVSAVSGNMYEQDIADGTYVLRGIIPGRPYRVNFEEINQGWVGKSGLGRYGDDEGELPRSGFGSGVITAFNGQLGQVMCEQGGQTIVMDTVQLDVAAGGALPPQKILNDAQTGVVVEPVTTDPGDGTKPTTTTTTPAAKGGCSLLLPR